MAQRLIIYNYKSCIFALNSKFSFDFKSLELISFSAIQFGLMTKINESFSHCFFLATVVVTVV